jgi:hypothetical protein
MDRRHGTRRLRAAGFEPRQAMPLTPADASRVSVLGGRARDLHDTLSGTAARAETVGIGELAAGLFFRLPFDAYLPLEVA